VCTRVAFLPLPFFNAAAAFFALLSEQEKDQNAKQGENDQYLSQ